MSVRMTVNTSDFQVVHDAAMQVGECPLWSSAEQAIYWVDIGGFQVHRVHPASGAHRAYAFESDPASLALHAGGGLVVATRAGFVHLDTDSGAITPIAAAPYDVATTRFNDGRVDAAGRFWVGTIFEPRDRQAAEMYCLDHGQVSLKWSGGMMNSNGLGFAPDNRAMYHADTAAHRINRYAFDLETGVASEQQLFQQFDTNKGAPGYGGRPTAPRSTAKAPTGAPCSRAAACCASRRPANSWPKSPCRCAARPCWPSAAKTCAPCTSPAPAMAARRRNWRSIRCRARCWRCGWTRRAAPSHSTSPDVTKGHPK